MLKSGSFKFYVLAAVALVAVLGVSSAMAQSDTYQVSYYSNAHTTGAPDGKVRITNPGTNNGSDLCADVYVFDNTEQLLECCGCRLTPDGLRTFSINADLTSNTANGQVLTTGVVKVISATLNPNAEPSVLGSVRPDRRLFLHKRARQHRSDPGSSGLGDAHPVSWPQRFLSCNSGRVPGFDSGGVGTRLPAESLLRNPAAGFWSRRLPVRYR